MFGSISVAELVIILVAGAAQLAILFGIVYWAVRHDRSYLAR